MEIYLKLGRDLEIFWTKETSKDIEMDEVIQRFCIIPKTTEG